MQNEVSKITNNLITPNLKSIMARDNYSQKIVSDLYETFKDEFLKGNVNLKSLETKLLSLTDNKYDIKVVKNKTSYKALAQINLDNNLEFTGFTIHLPVKRKYSKGKNSNFKINQNEIISLCSTNDCNSCFHEITHVADYISNPKYIKKYITQFNESNTVKNGGNFYYNNIYDTIDEYEKNWQQKLKHSIEIYLNSVPVEEKINILQLWRYLIKTEIRARANGKEFQEKINSLKSQKISKHRFIQNMYKKWLDKRNIKNYNFGYEEKINIINDILYETIQAERKKLSKHLAA